jgi:hypothetical protein
VPSLELPLGGRRSKEEEEDVGELASSCKDAPQKPNRSHMQTKVLEACSRHVTPRLGGGGARVARP